MLVSLDIEFIPARPETHRSGSASLAISTLFLVSPDKLDIKKPLTWYSLSIHMQALGILLCPKVGDLLHLYEINI